MKWVLVIAAVLVGQAAYADADYPVYACDGPHLDMLSPGGLSVDEVRAQFPDLRDPARLEFYILQDGDTARWTDQTRDELREMCLARSDQAHAPLSGTWTLTIDPFANDKCTAPPPIDAVMGAFPRDLTFGEVFHPTDVLHTDTIDWQLDRYPEDDMRWTAYAGHQNGVTDYRAFAAGFLQVSFDLIEIDLYVARTQTCHDNYTLFLQRAQN